MPSQETNKQQSNLYAFVMETSFSGNGWGNGYIVIPEEHPLYGREEISSSEVSVHKGFTLAEKFHAPDWKEGGVINGSKKELDDSKNYWILGFDTNSLFEKPDIHTKEYVTRQTMDAVNQLQAMMPLEPSASAERFLSRFYDEQWALYNYTTEGNEPDFVKVSITDGTQFDAADITLNVDGEYDMDGPVDLSRIIEVNGINSEELTGFNMDEVYTDLVQPFIDFHNNHFTSLTFPLPEEQLETVRKEFSEREIVLHHVEQFEQDGLSVNWDDDHDWVHIKGEDADIDIFLQGAEASKMMESAREVYDKLKTISLGDALKHECTAITDGIDSSQSIEPK